MIKTTNKKHIIIYKFTKKHVLSFYLIEFANSKLKKGRC